MKRIALLMWLALSLPVMSWANSSPLVFSNAGGTITSNGSTLTLSGSELTSFTFNGTSYTGDLGTVSLTTGSKMSGLLGLAAVFNGGGSITIMGNGSDGIPNGALFTGSFSGPVNWSGTPIDGTWTYVLNGTVSGTLSNGMNAFGNAIQFTFVTGNDPFGKGVSADFNDGITTVTAPEPGTLSLPGTGLAGLAGLIRRKLKA